LSQRITTFIDTIIGTHKRSIAIFLMVGMLTAAVYFFVFSILWKLLNIDYRVSVSIAYVLSVTFQFFTNRKVTFKSHGNNLFRQMLKYVVMLALNYIITITVVEFTVRFLLLSPYLGVVFSVGITVITGYLLSRLWIYKSV
jgi:putative flippase GtrA